MSQIHHYNTIHEAINIRAQPRRKQGQARIQSATTPSKSIQNRVDSIVLEARKLHRLKEEGSMKPKLFETESEQQQGKEEANSTSRSKEIEEVTGS